MCNISFSHRFILHLPFLSDRDGDIQHSWNFSRSHNIYYLQKIIIRRRSTQREMCIRRKEIKASNRQEERTSVILK